MFRIPEMIFFHLNKSFERFLFVLKDRNNEEAKVATNYPSLPFDFAKGSLTLKNLFFNNNIF